MKLKHILKLSILLTILFFSTLSFGAGTVTQTTIADFNPLIIPGSNKAWYVVTLSITADAAAATVPATVIQGTAATGTNAKLLWGWILYSVKTYPGAVAPTNNYSVTITDASGFDLLGGKAASNQSSTVAKKTFAFPDGGSFSPVLGPLTFNLTGNLVNSAKVTAVLEFYGEIMK